MARYHTLFTSFELQGPDEMGIPLPRGSSPRRLRPFRSRWLGRIGENQVGPTYLGGLGLASSTCGRRSIGT